MQFVFLLDQPGAIETVAQWYFDQWGHQVAGETVAGVRANLEKYLNRAGRVLDVQDRITIAEALAEVIVSDARITSKEINFFNMVAAAFQLTPAELAGLIENT